MMLIEHYCHEHEEKMNESEDGLIILKIYQAVHSNLESHSCNPNHAVWRSIAEKDLAKYREKK